VTIVGASNSTASSNGDSNHIEKATTYWWQCLPAKGMLLYSEQKAEVASPSWASFAW